MTTLRFVRSSLGASLRSALEYRTAFVLQAAFMALNNFAFLGFWALFFERFARVGSWRLADVGLLYAVSATGFGLAVVLAGGSLTLSESISSGRLDSWLLRPRPLLLQAWLARLRVSGFGDVATGVILVFAVGDATPRRIATWLVASLASGAALLAFWTALGALAFFAGETSELSRLGSNAVITFALYPPGLFTGLARTLLFLVVPAGLVGWLPTGLVLAWSWKDALTLVLGLGALWGVTLLAWRSGLRRYGSGNLAHSGAD